MSTDINLMDDLQDDSRKITLPDDRFIKSNGIGTVEIYKDDNNILILKEVLYLPEPNSNLISATTITCIILTCNIEKLLQHGQESIEECSSSLKFQLVGQRMFAIEGPDVCIGTAADTALIIEAAFDSLFLPEINCCLIPKLVFPNFPHGILMEMLVFVYGEECMSIQMVRRWRSWFLEGRQNVHDDERSGSPVTATDNAAVAAVRNVVEADRRVTIDEIMIRLPPGIEIRRSSIGIIRSEILNFLKVCTRWVPRLLLENHKQQRMEAARAFLEMHQRDGDQLFSRIVTGDESWVYLSTPETKRKSMVWKKPEESAPKKAKVTISAGKVMAMENFKWETKATKKGHGLIQQWYQNIASTMNKQIFLALFFSAAVFFASTSEDKSRFCLQHHDGRVKRAIVKKPHCQRAFDIVTLAYHMK
ncbi:hypothetical protein LAZ67_14003477 [Cordylochernes scorpioides]|uniref:Retrovirus-related Pol polyprotein from transposon TNT 1-94-like beta-barrel domain-containing protein n=1 Tax=Cordylochernes scorpioides TaxID=51811 RepID=A0ABY6L9M9_9ARAC|nr:hypothetical protein LAZ67_14003477 [Cordylochernes scorpioides]